MAKYKIWATSKEWVYFEANGFEEQEKVLIFCQKDSKTGQLSFPCVPINSILAMRDMSTNLINFYPKGDTNESYN